MFERLYPFLEIISIINCLHYMHGKKIKINLATILLIISDLILFEFINMYSMARYWSLLMYWFIALYILLEFPYSLRNMLLSNILYILIISLLQLSSGLIILILRLEFLTDNILFCIVNLNTLLLIYMLRIVISNFYRMLLRRNVLTGFIMILYFLVLIQRILFYKAEKHVSTEQFLSIFAFGVLLFITIYFWQKEKEKAYQKEMDLKMHEIYESSFKELIDAIRKRQHEFHNHLQAILCMHYTLHTYEELICEQEKYCNTLMESNKLYQLLTNDWPVVSGFLYGKLQEATEKHIEVKYNIKVNGKNEHLPEFILIEILGILLDNAIEALADVEKPVIRISLIENIKLELTVCNPINSSQVRNLSAFFQKGYSSKLNHAGLGLYKIIEYQTQYGLKKEILIEDYENREWLVIKLLIE